MSEITGTSDTEITNLPPKRRGKYVSWSKMIRRLHRFHNETGHCQPTKSQDPELHRWVQSIRTNYRHQVKSECNTTVGANRPRLPQDKMDVLNDMGFVWDVQEVAWDFYFGELCRFREQHGHFKVKTHHDRKLWVWARNQRRDYRQMQKQANVTTPLTPERFRRLDEIGFWEGQQSHQDVWDMRLSELVEYKEAHGHVNVPQDYEDNFALGQWVMNLRTDYKRYLAGLPTGLTRQRIASLERLDFCWNVNDYQWFSMLERLRADQYEEQENNTAMEDLEVQIWVTKQRHEYQRLLQNRTSTLTGQRIEALESIPNFSWRGRATQKRGPTAEDWAKLFEGMRQKGISPDMRPKQHWFEGQNPFQEELKDTWTEEELLALWNQEDGYDDDDEGEVESQLIV